MTQASLHDLQDLLAPDGGRNPGPPGVDGQPGTRGGDLAGARRSLRAQIARLDAQLAHGATSARRDGATSARHRRGGPRLLSLGELEAQRDRLAGALTDAGAERRAAPDPCAQARRRLERMIDDPAGYRFGRVTLEELGLPGCGAYASRPRLGILGMLAGWWEIRLSSGCPLPRGR